jgi:hypothetical protein
VRYADGVLEANVDAGLGADMQIELTGAPTLSVSATPGTDVVL